MSSETEKLAVQVDRLTQAIQQMSRSLIVLNSNIEIAIHTWNQMQQEDRENGGDDENTGEQYLSSPGST